MRFLLLVYVGFSYGKKGCGHSTRWYARACFFCFAATQLQYRSGFHIYSHSLVSHHFRK